MFLVKTCDKQCSNENKILSNRESHIMKEQKHAAQLLLRLQCKMCSYSNSDGLAKQSCLLKIVPTNFGIRCRDNGEKRQRNLCILGKLCRSMKSGLSLCCLGKLLHKALLLSFPKHLKILCLCLHYKRTINSICFQ